MQFRKVFDQKFMNGLPPIDKFSSPAVVNICRRGDPSTEPFRAQIERWFHNLPDEHKADIYSRLRNLDDKQHLSAVYELLFHQYCCGKGWKVQKHPSVKGKKPEFLAELPNQISFYLEVATIIDSDELRNKRQQYYGLLRRINAIKTNFLVLVRFERWPAENTNHHAIAKKTEEWLKMLVEREGEEYGIEINEFGFSGGIYAYYYPGVMLHTGSVYAWLGPPTVGAPAVQQVKSTISSKVKKYKPVKTSGKPFVIALCSGNYFFLDENTVETALYGNQIVSYNINGPRDEIKLHRDYSGLVTPNPGLLGQPRNTRISAVIFCARIWRDQGMLCKMRVFHNPWAITKLPFEVFEELPQLYEVKKSPKTITLQWHNDNNQDIVIE